MGAPTHVEMLIERMLPEFIQGPVAELNLLALITLQELEAAHPFTNNAHLLEADLMILRHPEVVPVQEALLPEVAQIEVPDLRQEVPVLVAEAQEAAAAVEDAKIYKT